MLFSMKSRRSFVFLVFLVFRAGVLWEGGGNGPTRKHGYWSFDVYSGRGSDVVVGGVADRWPSRGCFLDIFCSWTYTTLDDDRFLISRRLVGRA